MKKSELMKKRLIYALFMVALFTGFLFVSCSKADDDVVPEEILTASFSFIGGGRPAPAPIEFTSTSTLATELKWDFGDGNESTEKNLTHIYTKAGTYKVALTASDKAGESKTSTRTVEVWGELAGWYPRYFRLPFEYLSQLLDDEVAYLDDRMYMRLYDHNNILINYDDGSYPVVELSQDRIDGQYAMLWDFSKFEAHPLLIDLDKNITMKTYIITGENYVDPDNDILIAEVTLSSADFIPDEISPYSLKYIEENKLEVTIAWEEK